MNNFFGLNKLKNFLIDSLKKEYKTLNWQLTVNDLNLKVNQKVDQDTLGINVFTKLFSDWIVELNVEKIDVNEGFVEIKASLSKGDSSFSKVVKISGFKKVKS